MNAPATDTRRFDFFFDFTSPYSYLAAERVDALAARYGFAADWKPVLLGAIFKLVDAKALTALHPWKAEYSVMDFARSAKEMGLPYRHPSTFPQNTVHVSRAMLWLQRNRPDDARAFALEVFRTVFVRDGDVSSADTIAGIARALGLDADAILSATKDEAMKAALVAANEEAASKRVFGAPTFVLDGERFWGSDRLGQLETRLKERAGKKGFRALVDEAMERVVTRDVDTARAMLGREDTVFVDLRDPRELEREGVIPGALHAPRGMLEFWVDPDSPYHKPVFAQDREYVLFCGGGWRSALACRQMQEMGILPRVSHVEGGFTAWKQAGAPVEEKKAK